MSNPEERPTRKVDLPSGTTVVLKEFITYGENQSILKVMLDDKLSKSDQMIEVDKNGIETVIVELNGSKENIYDNFLKLPLIDARQLTKLIEPIINPKVEANP